MLVLSRENTLHVRKNERSKNKEELAMVLAEEENEKTNNRNFYRMTDEEVSPISRPFIIMQFHLIPTCLWRSA